MSSVEHRNELKNYLELASLAGEKPLNEQQSQGGGGKATKLYKRANPLIHQNMVGDLTEQQYQRMTNGFEQARKQSNNSQLQALNNANAQSMMPALQNHITGHRNQNNRTTMGQQHHSTSQTAAQRRHQNAVDAAQVAKNGNGGAYVNKVKREKPYSQIGQHQEPYRAMAVNYQAVQGAGGDMINASGQSQNPRFLAQRQSPGGAHSQMSKQQQYNDQMIQQQQQSFTSQVGPDAGSSTNMSNLQIYNGQQSSKLPAKFISQKAIGKTTQPVRARTNLDKYEDMNQSYNQGNLSYEYEQRRQVIGGSTPGTQQPVYHTIIGASSSVTTIPSIDGIYNGTVTTTNNNKTNGNNHHHLNSNMIISEKTGPQSNASNQENSLLQSLVQTPQTGAISARKLSSQFVKSTQKPTSSTNSNNNNNNYALMAGQSSMIGPYNHSANVTIEPISAAISHGSKKNKFQLHPSKMILEPLSTNSYASHNKELITNEQNSQINLNTSANNGDKSSYVMLPAATISQKTNHAPGSDIGNPNTGRSSFAVSVTKQATSSNQEQSEQQRRASHQPLSILQNRISSQMAYRCYSRQKESRVQSRGQGGTRGSRQRTTTTANNASGVGVGEGDIGPLPRAKQKLLSKQDGPQAMIVIQQHQHHQQMQMGMPGKSLESREQSARQENAQSSLQDPFETERQLIIARGGSLSRKVNHIVDDDEDVFNERGGFRIKINKEQKVVNHLEDRVENNNLLFYNFNAYKQQDQNTLDNSTNNYGSSASQYKAERNIETQVSHQQQSRPYSRTSAQSQSRQDYRQRNTQSAASSQAISRQQRHRMQVDKEEQITQVQTQQQLYRQESEKHVDSCTSLQMDDPQQQSPEPYISTGFDHEDSIDQPSNTINSHQQILRSSGGNPTLNKSSEKAIAHANGNLQNSRKPIVSNRYKQGGGGGGSVPPQQTATSTIGEIENRYRQEAVNNSILNLDNQSHSANRQEGNTNLAVNVASSGSLTTAATTKGSDFGTSKHNGHQIHTMSGGGGTPQRNGTISIMKEVFVPPRPTNTSRILHDQAHNQSMRKHRMQQRDSSQNSNKNEQDGQQSIIKASQTSIGSNSFARSAMRLKQKSSRNGIPNRGGSLDGCSQNAQSQSPSGSCQQSDDNMSAISQSVQQVKTSGIMSRAGRTAGGAMWSRMLNMQSVEEGIQEGNVSSEDD